MLGPSININICMSVQTVDSFIPSFPKMYKPTFWGFKTILGITQHYIYCTTKINSSSKPAMWQIIHLAMYYDLPIIVNIV